MKKIFLSFLLITSLVISNITLVFADSSSENIDYTNGTLNSSEFTEENKNQEVQVNVELGSSFSVKIPKTVTLDGTNGKANYEVSVSGDLTGEQIVNVVPDASFNLTQANRDDIITIVTQDKTSFTYDDTKDNTVSKANGLIEAGALTAGTWSGNFNFNVSISKNDLINNEGLEPGLYDSNNVMTMSWDEIIDNTELSIMEDGTLTSDNGLEDFDSERTNLQALTGKLVLKNNISSIGTLSFYKCEGLKEIIIPNSVVSIKDYAFAYCTNLTSVTIPNSVSEIGTGSFGYCSSLVNIDFPEEIEKIDSLAFAFCNNLKNIKIGKNVKNIGSYIVSGCDSLKSIIIDSNNPIYDSRDNCNAIIETETNTLVRGCGGSVIPDSVIAIGDSAFSGCTGLTEIIIPNSVVEIGQNSFSGCKDLISITIPNSVTKISKGAFGNCTGLTSIIIPDSVTSIDTGVFDSCNNLEFITVDSNNTVYDSRNNCNAIIETATNILISGCKNTIIPDSVTEIGYNSFSHCEGLITIDIPNSVTSINEWSFNSCKNLETVIIGNNVKSIGYYAFSECSKLTAVTIPDSVTYIGQRAFSKTNLKELTIPNNVKTIQANAFYNVPHVYYNGTATGSPWGALAIN